MEKITIQNRKGQKIVVIVEKPTDKQEGLAFVMHGLGGFKEQPHIVTFAEAFLGKGFTTIRFDTTNTFGESDGDYADATVTNYYEDLEDVIKWAKSQDWYMEPFALSGHSLGGICVALYAERHPDRVVALAPISPVVSGKLSGEREKHKKVAEEWQRTGWRIVESESEPGRIKKLKWSHMEDRLKYDLLPEAEKITMPILFIVGENDDSTPPEHVKMFHDAVVGLKEFHVIKDAPHTFRDPAHLSQIKDVFTKWIDSFINLR